VKSVSWTGLRKAFVLKSLRDKSPDTCPHFRLHFIARREFEGSLSDEAEVLFCQPLSRLASEARSKRRTVRSRKDDDEHENEVLPAASHFNQIAQRGLKQILDWEKALGQSSNRTLER
jgi:hypothetical protein